MPQTHTNTRRVGKIMVMASFAVIIAIVSGCGLFQKKEQDLPYTPLPDPAALPAATGGNVLSVNGEAVTVAEMVDATKAMMRPGMNVPDYPQFQAAIKPRLTRLIHSRIAEIVVYQEAKKEFDTSFDDKLEQAVETEVQRYVSTFNGDYAAADRDLARQKMTWQSFRDMQKRQILTQVYIQKQLGDPKPITHNDLVAFYDSIKDAEYLVPGILEVRVIDIQPDAIELSDPNQDRLLAAKDIAVEVAARARAGEDFAYLAGRYSSDHSKDRGGLWNPIEPGSLAPPYDVIEKAAMDMEPNSIAGPIAANGHFFIVRLEKKQVKGYRPFEEVQHEVQRRINESRREKAFDDIMRKRIDLTKVGDIDTFIEACVFATYNDLKKEASSPGAGQ
jgi:peptidyl-prolyl cis-trans isomerase SurA